ncbi:hypothetical protein [Chryseobacterium sp. ISL-6]|uniref:hypothetical protein n=1 Tax=Chryseobacterium sp. ISL-6 TaxID=2819143 RepID=UPI001BEA75C0|nr:hypothetical protein [Chryseobacterium sp. ISL-6]MBT2622540.1 hypothetical protein [Chryseobacterium sp. ISL-6]
MKQIIDKYFHFICIGTVIILVLSLIIKGNFDAKRILKNPKYTIAVIVGDWHHKNNNGIGVDYEYMVNNQKYSSTINVDVKKGERYLLIFDSLKPKNHVLLDVYPIYESVNPPTKGWTLNEVRVKVDTAEIRNMVLGD